MDTKRFEEKIGYCFSDPLLLRDALHHSSFPKAAGNVFDRMEYLGDAVLELVISTFLYQTFPQYSEGLLTKVRTGIVSEPSLSEAARQIGIPAVIVLGKGEEHSGGRDKDSILSDAYEAVVGAVYLDGGLDAAKEFVIETLKQNIMKSVENGGVLDYKTKLQEYLQSLSTELIEYRTESVGENNQPYFLSRVFHGGRLLGEGKGRKKKTAEQMAAKQALADKGV